MSNRKDTTILAAINEYMQGINEYMQGIYVICDNEHITPSTMGLTIQVKRIDNDTIYKARVLYGMQRYRIRDYYLNSYAIKVMREVNTMTIASTITNGMAPKVMATFPEDLDQIDVNTNGICCIVVFEDITSILPMNTLGDKDTKVQILYTVGSAISALHKVGIYYQTFDANAICIQDNAIRLMNIGKNFKFEESAGICMSRAMDFNNSYIAPELIFPDIDELVGNSEQQIDAYAFGMYLFTIIFQEYSIFPELDERNIPYGSRNPVQSEVLEEHKTRQLAIWNDLPQDLKNLFGGLPNTYPDPEHPTRQFERIGRFIAGTEQFIADTKQPIKGLLCQDPAMRLTISESLDNAWFREYTTQPEESASSEESM